ncbi:Protein of unknown function [Propionibacterium freudenreichii]|nr:Protein of unknown function [Propionibacterium freudenreichii]
MPGEDLTKGRSGVAS